MRTVCIVTNEMYPVHRGGIGRLAYNFAVTNAKSKNRVDLHFLLPANLREQEGVLKEAFEPLATVHFCDDTADEIGQLGRAVSSGAPRDSLDFHATESLRYYAGLLAAQRLAGKPFDVVEFPDFSGWAAASIDAKHSGLAFHNTCIAVRLHSSMSLIVDHEPFAHLPSDWMAGVCDLERHAIREADLIVAHLRCIAELNAARFSVEEGWQERVRIEFPPITLAPDELSALDAPQRTTQDAKKPHSFLFSARLQPFKRPDVFIRAAVLYLDANPGDDTLFVVAAYGWDKKYIAWLKSLAPARYRDQIRFLDNITGAERAQLMRDSILVIPSDFESLCLLAYEARQLGCKVILNRRCSAFGTEPLHWRENLDCLFFEGDPVSLAQTMRQALTWQPAAPLPDRPDTPYWELPTGESRLHPAPARGSPLRIAHILYGAESLDDCARQIDELQSRSSDELHVLIPREALAQTSISGWESDRVNIYLTSWIDPTPSEFLDVISRSDCELISFVPGDMRIERQFWHLAAREMTKQGDVAVFTCHAALSGSSAENKIVLNYGAAPTVALLADRIAHRASVFRRAMLLQFGLREVAGDRWFEDLCTRIVTHGHRVLVAPAILVTQIRNRHSRISSELFFGTLRDEAGAARGLPYRQASAGARWSDSIQSVDQNAFEAMQLAVKGKLTAGAPGLTDMFSFDHAELERSVGKQSDVRQLTINLHDLKIGGTSLLRLRFKLCRHKCRCWIEFRSNDNVEKLFQPWPPSTTDLWGPVAIWSNAGVFEPYEALFQQATDQMQKLLRLLLKYLPSIVSVLPLDPEEKSEWRDVALELGRVRKSHV